MASDAEKQVTEESFGDVVSDDQALPGELPDEVIVAEAILLGMLEEGPIEPAAQRSPGDLFKEEEPAGLEYPPDLAYGDPPIRDVVDGSEVEDRVEHRGRVRDPRRISNP
jgi:hypothetical protein